MKKFMKDYDAHIEIIFVSSFLGRQMEVCLNWSLKIAAKDQVRETTPLSI